MVEKEFTDPVSLKHDESGIKNEVNCRAFNCILVFMKETYGEKALQEFIAQTGMTLEYLEDQNNWVSWSYYCDLLEALVEWTGDAKAPYKAGTYSGHKKSWGYLYYIFYAFGNVGQVIKKGIEIVPHFNKAAEWTLLNLQNNHCTFRIRMKEGYEAKRICCESRMGQFAGIPRAFGMPMGKARETQCQALGADSCICEVSWLNRPKRLFGFLGLFFGFLFILILNLGVIGAGINYGDAFLILVVGYLSGSLVDYRLHEKENIRINQEQTAALEESVNLIETKYLELKKVHDGLFALHEISQAVTSTLRLDDVLTVLLKMVVDQLGFDRSMVMLTDEKSGILHQGRIYGDESLKGFVEELKVPLNLNSPMAEEVLRKKRCQIVTKDFIEGDEASELGKRIYKFTHTKEYVIAPLLSKDRLLGVLASDNVRSGRKITDEDKVLMVSLANQAAMAIENAQSFQTIEDLNINLEKKVMERTGELVHSLQELKEAQEQLIHTEKMSSLGLLCSGLTHEINNPINFAYNGITALRKSIEEIHHLARECAQEGGMTSIEEYNTIQARLLKTSSEADRLMEIIDSGLKRTRDLVVDLKHFSRKDQKDPEFLLLQTPIESALTILNHEMSGRITIHKDFRFSDHIQGYPDQLNQVFLNLLLNSIQAIPDKGNIWIQTEPAESGEVRIRVRDDGTGIREEDLPRVFEPFFTTKKSGQGTGLGMSICQRIIDNHGGKIKLNSEVGSGTEVIMTLPVRLHKPVRNGDLSGGCTLGKN